MNRFSLKKETITQKLFNLFFITSNQYLTQTQIFTLKLTPNLTQTPTQTLILTFEMQMKNARMIIDHFLFALFKRGLEQNQCGI